MNYHTDYPIAPGVYHSSVLNDLVVVKTVLTHNATAHGTEPIELALVIFEPLMQDILHHKAYSMVLDEFLKFHSPA